MSAIKPLADCNNVGSARIWLSVDDVLKQDANTDDMILDVPSIVAELSTYFELKAGDLIFTGTPSGVDAVSVGNCIRAGIDGLGELKVNIMEGE